MLFVITSGTNDLNTALEEKIKKALRDKASPRHVPAIIIPVLDLPRTRSGKLSELAVKAVVKGTTVRNAEALANPEALDYFKDLKELQ
mgnify:CR=1 FL=1